MHPLPPADILCKHQSNHTVGLAKVWTCFALFKTSRFILKPHCGLRKLWFVSWIIWNRIVGLAKLWKSLAWLCFEISVVGTWSITGGPLWATSLKVGWLPIFGGLTIYYHRWYFWSSHFWPLCPKHGKYSSIDTNLFVRWRWFSLHDLLKFVFFTKFLFLSLTGRRVKLLHTKAMCLSFWDRPIFA